MKLKHLFPAVCLCLISVSAYAQGNGKLQLHLVRGTDSSISTLVPSDETEKLRENIRDFLANKIGFQDEDLFNDLRKGLSLPLGYKEVVELPSVTLLRLHAVYLGTNVVDGAAMFYFGVQPESSNKRLVVVAFGGFIKKPNDFNDAGLVAIDKQGRINQQGKKLLLWSNPFSASFVKPVEASVLQKQLERAVRTPVILTLGTQMKRTDEESAKSSGRTIKETKWLRQLCANGNQLKSWLETRESNFPVSAIDENTLGKGSDRVNALLLTEIAFGAYN